jgi:uncharacterized membrane protein YidH (DUF202 family)
MTTTDLAVNKRLRGLLEDGQMSADQLRDAEYAATARGVEIEAVLSRECGVEKSALLKSLSKHYGVPFVEYDERMPIPPELLEGLDGERLSMSCWFPVIKDGDTVVIAANDPEDPGVREEVKRYIKAERYEFRVALVEDIQWFIQDFLHAKPGCLIGTERTGLAFWRNTMAHWRTRLACYRTDMAKARTELAFLRWGLGLIALSDTLMRTHRLGSLSFFAWPMIALGLSLAVFGLTGYLKIRRSIMKPGRHQTIIEVTAATMPFLENYHFIENTGRTPETKGTMLARLGDFLADHCTILYPSPASKERTHLARERNVLAAQRTIAGCYRTIYARARTGLAFIRTGVSFTSLGLGLMRYFGLSVLTAFDSLLVAGGILMSVEGLLWYLPVRKEQAEIPRCPVPE